MGKILSLSPIFCAFVLFSGCETTAPPSADETLASSLPQTTSVAETFTANAARPDVGAIPSNWIDAFGDPRLRAIVDEALTNNLNLRAAASQVEASAGLVTQASSQMKPVIAASGEATEQSLGGGIENNSRQGALSVSWELDIWGKIRSQTAAAAAQFEAVTAEYEYARLSLKAQVAKSWFMAVETRQQLSFAQEVVALYERTLDITDAKYEFGDVGMKEVHLARADLASAKERLRQVDAAHRIATRSLELLLGRYPSAELEVASEFAAVPPSVPVGLPSELLERRPDLVAAERRVAAAFRSTAAAKATRLPSIGLTAAGGGTNNQLVDLLGGGDSFWSVGANFLAPLYAGGALQAEVEIANARQEAALADFGQRALIAFGEVENALSNEGLLSEREELLDAIVMDNARALDLAQSQYESGTIELLSVLQMQGRLVASKVALISIRNARLAERINLHLALGGDFNGEEQSS